jgi:hypothetical protein
MLIDFLDWDAYPINLGEVFLYDCKGVSAMLVVPSEWSVDLFMDKLKRVTCRASNRCYCAVQHRLVDKNILGNKS